MAFRRSSVRLVTMNEWGLSTHPGAQIARVIFLIVLVWLLFDGPAWLAGLAERLEGRHKQQDDDDL